MQLMLKDDPVLHISENGACQALEFDRLPFALRKEPVTYMDFVDWAAGRTLSISRSHAKEIMNSLGLSQSNSLRVCLACRGLSLTDSYWIRQPQDPRTWAEINLFQNELSFFLTELALSGTNTNQSRPKQNELYEALPKKSLRIHTPELTTMGASAKGWIRQKDGLYLYKVGKNEVAASQMLDVLKIPHIAYFFSAEEETAAYLSPERKLWLDGTGERLVKSRLFTNEDTALVTFEEFVIFCEAYGLNPWQEARAIDREAYLQMQVADYILNNDDRHQQNWGFLMENSSGKLLGYVPLFDHDHAFSAGKHIFSQTREADMTLEEAAVLAQQELHLDVAPLLSMEKPGLLEEEKWQAVLGRCRKL